MKKMRAASMIILTLCLCISVIFPVEAASNTTTSDKASILNMLSIIKGNGVDYNLNGQLTRCEAAVFIIRIMGKESYVTTNAQKYKVTKFPDVSASSWYAPYVGYCAGENIIGGYLDGKFGPDDNISEKAFLKLVLGALDYKVGVDFTWDNIYQAAFNTGIVTDSSYKDKTADNNKYTRGDVVDVLYNSLTLKGKDEKLSVIRNLIADQVVTKETAYATGLIQDETETAIQEITVQDESKISIKLNESVENITAGDITICETQKVSNKLTVSIESQSGADIVVKTSTQTPDVSYTIEMSNIVDMEGNTTDNLTGTFTGYRNPEIKSDFFKISKIEPVSKNTFKRLLYSSD